MRADGLPILPLASHAVLGAGDIARLFGAGYALRGAEQVDVYRLGRLVARVSVAQGPDPALMLSATDLDATGLDAAGMAPGAPAAAVPALRLRGPLGATHAPAPAPIRARLVLPEALRLAWRLPQDGHGATVALGPLALAVPVETGRPAGLAVDRALWLAAGRPQTARWLPHVVLAPPAPAPAEARVVTIERRVVTETDVRQARLRQRRIRLAPGQVVTPAAQSLAREWDVFETG